MHGGGDQSDVNELTMKGETGRYGQHQATTTSAMRTPGDGSAATPAGRLQPTFPARERPQPGGVKAMAAVRRGNLRIRGSSQAQRGLEVQGQKASQENASSR